MQKITEIVDFLNPDYVYFYKNKHEFVEQLKTVAKGELLLKTETKKIYASISGTLHEKENIFYIENDFQETNYRTQEEITSILKLSKDEILSIVEEIYSIQGVLLEDLFLKNDILFVNMTSNPSISLTNTFLVEEYTRLLLDTISVLQNTFQKEIVLFVSQKEIRIIKKINSILASYPDLRIKKIDTLFPSTQSNILRKKYFHNKTKVGYIELDMLYEIGRSLQKRKPMQEKYIFLTGSAMPKNYLIQVKKGTSIYEVVKVFAPKTQECQYFINNPLLKHNDSSALDQTVDEIHTLFIEHKKENTHMPCINCGKCIVKCPMHIDPRKKDMSKCIKCGICNVVCPSNINLVYKEDNYE